MSNMTQGDFRHEKSKVSLQWFGWVGGVGKDGKGECHGRHENRTTMSRHSLLAFCGHSWFFYESEFLSDLYDNIRKKNKMHVKDYLEVSINFKMVDVFPVAKL